MGYTICFPEDFDDGDWWEIQMKGCIELTLLWDNRSFSLNFFSSIKLGYLIEDAISIFGCFIYDGNLIVVNVVSRTEIEAAVYSLFKAGRFNWLAEQR